MILPSHQTPLHPKRHIVEPRNWAEEPQQRRIDHSGYLGRTLNPYILNQLRGAEAFNHVAGE